MRKKIALLICLVMCVAALCPLYANAATPLDPAAEASLTLCYQKDEQKFSDLQISIFRVAEAFSDGTFDLIEPFAYSLVDIHGITNKEQWQIAAVTLNSYIVSNQISPDRVEKTDADGIATFSQLETGLYFVKEVVTENEFGTYIFDQFFVYLPTLNENGSFNYNVEAKPKCTSFVPKTEYRVTKLWKNDSKKERPKQITVDIYKDGALFESRILSAENNWSYAWKVSEADRSEWTVAERTVSKGYKVTVQKNGSSFSIVNTKEGDPDRPDTPQTGDTANPFLWILITCISGIMLIIIGIYSRRKSEV